MFDDVPTILLWGVLTKSVSQISREIALPRLLVLAFSAAMAEWRQRLGRLQNAHYNRIIFVRMIDMTQHSCPPFTIQARTCRKAPRISKAYLALCSNLPPKSFALFFRGHLIFLNSVKIPERKSPLFNRSWIVLNSFASTLKVHVDEISEQRAKSQAWNQARCAFESGVHTHTHISERVLSLALAPQTEVSATRTPL